MEEMGSNNFDIFAASVAFSLVLVLSFVKMPGGELWKPFRRMNKLLIMCYSAMSVSNVVTAMCGVSDSNDPIMSGAMLLVSMYQAMLFTASCVVFVAPHKISIGWLVQNALAITLVVGLVVAGFVVGGRYIQLALWGCIAIYIAQLIYYCFLFKRCYDRSLQVLEENFDEDMRDSLRLVKNSFLGALTVGVSALVFAIFQLGGIWYITFTCIYTIYYIYIVICILNYRISSGYILKVVSTKSVTEVEKKKEVPDDMPPIDAEEELRISKALDKWVEQKMFIHNDQTVEDIAAALGTTHTVMKWYFSTRKHTTFRSWRQRLRVVEAQRILREEKVSTSTLHTLVGITDKSNFHKLFRQYVGMTLREYQQAYLQIHEPESE